MDKGTILRFAEAPWNGRGGALVHGAQGSGQLTTGIGHFEPGHEVAPHIHNCDESVCIVEGDAVCEVNGETYTLRRFDTTFMPAGVPHRFLNLSDRPMKILWIYAAGYVTTTFLESGQTIVHAGSRQAP